MKWIVTDQDCLTRMTIGAEIEKLHKKQQIYLYYSIIYIAGIVNRLYAEDANLRIYAALAVIAWHCQWLLCV